MNLSDTSNKSFIGGKPSCAMKTIRPAAKSEPVAANLSHKQWRKEIWNHSPTLRSMKSA